VVKNKKCHATIKGVGKHLEIDRFKYGLSTTKTMNIKVAKQTLCPPY